MRPTRRGIDGAALCDWVGIVSSATISDQLTLGRLKLVPMHDLPIEHALWQLKVPGRIGIPAATAFERAIWQEIRTC